MKTPAGVNIRSIVDEIALQLAEARDDENDLSEKICDLAMEHITRLRDEHAYDEKDFERIARAIIKGVLIRLNEIAEGGGQIGNA